MRTREFVKCWTGNLDGKREGLVIASSKKKAAKVIGTSLNDFNQYWESMTKWPSQVLKPYTLYTRPYDAASGTEYMEGRCP